MSMVHGNGDLMLMNEYDFKTPINATVIIYDDEEESKPIEEENSKNDTSCNLDDIVVGVINDIFRATNKDKHNANTDIGTESALDNSKTTDLAEPNKRDDLIILNQNKVTHATNQAENFQIQNLLKDNHSLNNNTETNSQGISRHPQVSVQQTAYSTNQNDANQQVKKTIQELLNTVSTHMIFIMKAFEDYKAISSRTSDTTVLHSAWKRYYDTKCRFFYLSYSAVSNIMIPRENDKDFLENFIDNTVKLAKTRHLYYKPADMEVLCKKMLHWAKSRMQYPVLADLLQIEPTTKSCREQQGCMTSNVDSTCLFRSGPAGRELTITVNSSVAKNGQSIIQQCNDPQKLASIQNTVQPSELRNYRNDYMQRVKSYQSCKQITTHPYKSKQCCHSNPANKVQVESYQYQQYNYQTPTPRSRLPPPYYLPQTNNQLSVPAATVINPQNTETQITNPARYNNFQGDQEQLEVSRTLSRDSGFMSPLSSVSNDPMCSAPRYEFDSSASAGTPMITHVTSLNPSVAFISDGVCHVCGTLTKQKCLGCYKCYYCSHQCQTADWKYHYFICK